MAAIFQNARHSELVQACVYEKSHLANFFVNNVFILFKERMKNRLQCILLRLFEN